MKANLDPIFIAAGLMLIVGWRFLWKSVPPDLRVLYVFLLPIILIPLLYIAFVRNRFAPTSWAKGLLWIVIVIMGIVSFCHSILDFEILKELGIYH